MPKRRKNKVRWLTTVGRRLSPIEQVTPSHLLNFLCLFSFFLLATPLFSQKTARLLLQLDSAGAKILQEKKLADTAAALPVCKNLIQNFREQSHLAVSLDSLTRLDDSSFFAKIYVGPVMRWLRLQAAATVRRDWLRAANFQAKDFRDRPLRHDEFLKLEEKLLVAAEDAGFPFAQIWLDSVQVFENGEVAAVLQVAENQYFKFGNIKVANDDGLRLPPNFLSNFLAIRRGAAFSRSKILQVPRQLSALPFLENTAPPLVLFSKTGEADVQLFLKKRRAGRFDFLIGLLPRTGTANGATDAAADGRVLLTGSLLADFRNALGRGEHLRFEIERLRPETQKLDIEAALPYLVGLPIGVAGHLRVFRRDSSWVEATADFGLRYFLLAENFVQFFWENRSDFLQKIDTAALVAARQLPPNLDFRQNGIGVSGEFSDLDYKFNPRRGWLVFFKTSAGFSNLRRNSAIENLRDPSDPSFSFSALYDSLAGRAARFRLEFRGDFFQPVFERSTVKIGLRGGAILSPDRPVFQNEQYRLGGSRLLRGFDEESLFATRWAVGTAEYRLLIGQNAYLAAFADFGYLENLTARNRQFLRPVGAGAGMNFETRAGIFGISMAAGRRDRVAGFDFRALKFHLGYVSQF